MKRKEEQDDPIPKKRQKTGEIIMEKEQDFSILLDRGSCENRIKQEFSKKVGTAEINTPVLTLRNETSLAQGVSDDDLTLSNRNSVEMNKDQQFNTLASTALGVGLYVAPVPTIIGSSLLPTPALAADLNTAMENKTNSVSVSHGDDSYEFKANVTENFGIGVGVKPNGTVYGFTETENKLSISGELGKLMSKQTLEDEGFDLTLTKPEMLNHPPEKDTNFFQEETQSIPSIPSPEEFTQNTNWGEPPPEADKSGDISLSIKIKKKKKKPKPIILVHYAPVVDKEKFGLPNVRYDFYNSEGEKNNESVFDNGIPYVESATRKRMIIGTKGVSFMKFKVDIEDVKKLYPHADVKLEDLSVYHTGAGKSKNARKDLLKYFDKLFKSYEDENNYEKRFGNSFNTSINEQESRFMRKDKKSEETKKKDEGSKTSKKESELIRSEETRLSKQKRRKRKPRSEKTSRRKERLVNAKKGSVQRRKVKEKRAVNTPKRNGETTRRNKRHGRSAVNTPKRSGETTRRNKRHGRSAVNTPKRSGETTRRNERRVQRRIAVNTPKRSGETTRRNKRHVRHAVNTPKRSGETTRRNERHVGRDVKSPERSGESSRRKEKNVVGPQKRSAKRSGRINRVIHRIEKHPFGSETKNLRKEDYIKQAELRRKARIVKESRQIVGSPEECFQSISGLYGASMMLSNTISNTVYSGGEIEHKAGKLGTKVGMGTGFVFTIPAAASIVKLSLAGLAGTSSITAGAVLAPAATIVVLPIAIGLGVGGLCYGVTKLSKLAFGK